MNKRMQEILKEIESMEVELTTQKTNKEFEKAKETISKIRGLQSEYEVEKATLEFEKSRVPDNIPNEGATKSLSQAEKEEKSFKQYISDYVNKAGTPQNLDAGSNGAVIPHTIADRIIEEIKVVSPLLASVDLVQINGTYSIPVYGGRKDSEGNIHNITCAFADEFQELTADSGGFTAIELKGFLYGALTLVSKRLVNNSKFDIVGFIVRKMAEAVANFLIKECISPSTDDKIKGLAEVTLSVESSAASKINADDIIDLKDKVIDAYQANGQFLMHSETRTAIRKLKYSDGKYIFDPETNTLIGKPIMIDDNMPKIADGNVAIYYGDFSGLTVKLRESMEMQILLEVYASQHALGVVTWDEADAKVTDKQKLAKLTIKRA